MAPPTERLRDGATPGSTRILPRNAYKMRPGLPQRKRPTWWLFFVLVFVVLPVVAVSYQLGIVAAAIGANDPRVDRPATVPTAGYTILLVGVDDRGGSANAGIRSDTLMLARINPTTGAVSLLSIPRDTRVEVRGRGTSKINAAYAYGYLHPQDLYADNVSQQEAGMALAAETVEWFTNMASKGVRVDYTMQINFEGFALLIDALGGLDIDVPSAIVDNTYPTADYGTMRVEFQPGRQHMDGTRALIYARTRHPDSDFGRNQRQQLVVSALVSRLGMLGVADVGRLFLEAPQILAGTLKTTIPFTNPRMVQALVMTLWHLDATQITTFRIAPQTVKRYTADGTDLVWDEADVAALTEQWIARAGTSNATSDGAIVGSLNDARDRLLDGWQQAVSVFRERTGITAVEGLARIQVLNGARVAGLARRVTQQLNAVGFTLDAPGDVSGTVPETIIYDINNHPVQAAQITKIIRGRVVQGPPPMDIQSTADIIIVLGTDFVAP
ncbi:MAG: hypothetical protein RLY87_738 [Chloroflexota bacterium]